MVAVSRQWAEMLAVDARTQQKQTSRLVTGRGCRVASMVGSASEVNSAVCLLLRLRLAQFVQLRAQEVGVALAGDGEEVQFPLTVKLIKRCARKRVFVNGFFECYVLLFPLHLHIPSITHYGMVGNIT